MADGTLLFDTKLDARGIKSGILGIAGAVTGAGAMVLGLGGYALKASIDFESAFAGVRKTVDATESEFKVLEKGILDMSKTMPASASEIAKVAESAGQLGIQKGNILEFSKTMIMLGEATNMSAETAATQFARFANIVGMSQKDFSRLGSTVVALGNNMATTESEIVDMSMRLAATGKQVGFTESQIMALSATMSSLGINAEAGGSSMSRILAKINSEAISGGEHLTQFAQVAGMSAEQFAQKWKTAPTEAFQSFLKGLNDVKEKGGDVDSILKDLGIHSIQDIDAIKRLAGSTQLLTYAMNIGAKAWGDNSALQKEYNAKLQTTKAQIEMVVGKLNALSIAVGNNLKVSMLDSLNMANKWVDQLSTAFEIGGFDGLSKEFGQVIAEMINYGSMELPKFINIGSNMVNSLITGLMNNSGTIGASVVNILGSIGNGISTILPNLVNAGMQIAISLFQGLADNANQIPIKIGELAMKIGEIVISNTPNLIQAGLNLVVGLVQGICQGIPGFIENAPRLINEFSNKIYEKIPDILVAGGKILLALGKGLIEGGKALVLNLPQILMAIINVFTLFNWKSIGESMIKKIGEGMKALGKELIAIGKNMISNLKEDIKFMTNGFVSSGRNIISNIINGIYSMVGGFINAAYSIISAGINAIRATIGRFIEIGSNIIHGIVNGIRSAGGAILSALGDIVGGAIDWVKGKLKINSPSKVFRDEVGISIPEGIAAGIDKKSGSVKTSIVDVAKKSIEAGKAIFKSVGQSIGLHANGEIAKGMSKKDSIIDVLNQTGSFIAKHMQKNLQDSNIMEEAELEKHMEKMKNLRMTEIDKAYRAYGDLILIATQREQNKVAELEKQIEKSRTIKKNQETTKRLQAELKVHKETAKALEKYSKDFKDSYDKIVDDYQKAVDKILQDKDRMQEKLSTFGDIMEAMKDSEGHEMKYDDGISKVQIANQQKKLDQLKEYGEILDSLQARGADTEFMNKLIELPVEQALSWGRTLLEQSQQDFNNFIEMQKRQREMAQNIASKFYKENLDQLQKEYTGRLQENLSSVVGKSREMGKSSAEALASGFKNHSNKFKLAVSNVVDEAISSAMEKLKNFREETAGNVTNNNNYNVNIKEIKTTETAKEISKLDSDLAWHNTRLARGRG